MREGETRIPLTQIQTRAVSNSEARQKRQAVEYPKDSPGTVLPAPAIAREQSENAKRAEIRKQFQEEATAQWEKYYAETTPEERERSQKKLAEESARIRAIPDEVIQANIRSWFRASQREEARKQAYIHAGDPRYDPMTGELLKPDEFPLSPTSEYLLQGKTRPRRFVPPGSPHVKAYKPLQLHAVDTQPETEKNERRIQRLLKAGFTEVAPVGDDWQYFAFCERLRNMSPAEISEEWQEIQREMKQGTPSVMEYDPGKDWLLQLCKMLKDMMQALINEGIEEAGRKKN
jgi:hypothetical protein